MTAVIFAKALKLGSLREWPVCLWVCGILPEGTVNIGIGKGIGKDSRWHKQCRERNRIPCSRLLQEDIDAKMKEIDAVAMAGEKWAEHDKHPWELFAICLHNMFLALLRACKVKEDEIGHFSTPKTGWSRGTRTLGGTRGT